MEPSPDGAAPPNLRPCPSLRGFAAMAIAQPPQGLSDWRRITARITAMRAAVPFAAPLHRAAVSRAGSARRQLRGLTLAMLLLAAAQARPGWAGSAASAARPLSGEGADASALSARCAAAQGAIEAQVSHLRSALPGLDALLLGEIHTSRADHAWQLATLEAVRQRRLRLSLGLEMVPAARQAVLDRYSAGQINEEAFLNQVGWQEVWGHDPDLYLPLLRWARQQGVPLLALNAEPELVKRVRRQGLAAIPGAEREGIGTPVSAGPAYRKRLEMAWRGHRVFTAPQPPHGTPGIPGLPTPVAQPGATDRATSAGARPPASNGPSGATRATGVADAALSAAEASDLQRFLDSQLLRDRAMAERIGAAHHRDPGRLVVALIGRGHLEDGDGVPRQLADLGLERQLSLTRVPMPDGCGPPPARARLGAYLESDNGAVWVRRVAAGSAAEAAGLRPGDRILQLNGMAVDHAGQVIRGVRLQPDGVPLRLTIEREGRRLQLQLDLPTSTESRQASRDNGNRSGDRSRPVPRPFSRPHPLALSPP